MDFYKGKRIRKTTANSCHLITTIQEIENVWGDFAKFQKASSCRDGQLGAPTGGIRTAPGGIRAVLGGIRAALGGIRTALGGISTPVGGIRTALGGIRPALGGIRMAVGGIPTAWDKTRTGCAKKNIKIF